MTPEEEQWSKSFEELKDGDYSLYLVFADWLEEQGKQPLAQGWRWLAENKKHPAVSFGHTPFGWFETYSVYHEKRKLTINNSLPRSVCRELIGTGFCWDKKYFALNAAATAWSKSKGLI